MPAHQDVPAVSGQVPRPGYARLRKFQAGVLLVPAVEPLLSQVRGEVLADLRDGVHRDLQGFFGGHLPSFGPSQNKALAISRKIFNIKKYFKLSRFKGKNHGPTCQYTGAKPAESPDT